MAYRFFFKTFTDIHIKHYLHLVENLKKMNLIINFEIFNNKNFNFDKILYQLAFLLVQLDQHSIVVWLIIIRTFVYTCQSKNDLFYHSWIKPHCAAGKTIDCLFLNIPLDTFQSNKEEWKVDPWWLPTCCTALITADLNP